MLLEISSYHLKVPSAAQTLAVGSTARLHSPTPSLSFRLTRGPVQLNYIAVYFGYYSYLQLYLTTELNQKFFFLLTPNRVRLSFSGLTPVNCGLTFVF